MMYQYHRIKEGLEAWAWRSPHRDIVTLLGMAKLDRADSYPPIFLELWSDLLDKGHAHRDKIGIAQVIESLGAHVSFDVHQGYLCWSAECLAKDVPVIYEELERMIWHSVFPEEEIKLWLKLSESECREALSEPSSQVSIAFNRLMYPESHPLRRMSIQESLAWLESADVSALRASLQACSLGAHRIILVGDVVMSRHIEALMAWPQGRTAETPRVLVPELTRLEASTHHIELADKTSLDVRLGHSLALDVHHEDFWPLYVGVDALGGSFSARLMRTVRDVEGLTYGVSAGVQHCFPGLGGSFVVGITLAPESLERGIASTRRQVVRWWQGGLEPAELAARQRGLIGRHVVRATKTKQIAAFAQYGLMHALGEDYGSQYPDYIKNISLESVNAAIQRWIDPEQLLRVTAGTAPSAD